MRFYGRNKLPQESEEKVNARIAAKAKNDAQTNFMEL